MKDDELPDSMQRMSATQRQDFLDSQETKRKVLNDKMAALVKQRDRFIAEQAKKTPKPAADAFDRAVAETLSVQVKR